MLKKCRFILITVMSLLFIISVKSYPQTTIEIITTTAGNGARGFSGDGENAVDASLYYPFNAAVDAAGNMYIADKSNNRIRKVTPAGIISTIAGTGYAGYYGEGILATEAWLRSPTDVAVDDNGNVYIVDSKNHRIRKIDNSGIITTVAGSGVAGFYGDGGQAIYARLDEPIGIDIDSNGNLYIADMYNNRIRKVDNSGVITTVVGDGNAGYYGDGVSATSTSLYQPADVDVDGSGNMYIADLMNHRIRKVDGSEIITTVAGSGDAGFSGDGGSALNAELNRPYGIALVSDGSFYITDLMNHRIRKVASGGIINTVSGNNGTKGFSGDGGDPADALLNYPRGIVVRSNGDVLFADSENHRIRKIFTITGFPPVLNSVGNQNVNEGDTLRVNISASDPDADSIFYSVAGLPSFASFIDSGNGNGLLTITPDNDDIGTYSGIVITVSDGYFTDAETISITVNNALPPETPQNLSVTGAANAAELSWSPNTDRYILQYNIYQNLNNGFTPTSSDSIGRVLSSDTSFTDSTVVLNTTYYYRISAIDSSYLESGFSNQVFITPEDMSAPDIPQNLTASAGERFIDLQWNTNTESDIFYYTVYKSTTDDFSPSSSDSI
ncbi:hypothetical protein KAS50_00355, partial [bacterium]|nr:hypothetical protein [bacterium]